jgi:hypothetical protein
LRFLGRKVYLGSIIVLLTALEQGLTPSRRQRLIESLDLWPQTLYRLRRWWQSRFSHTPCWRSLQLQFLPPISSFALPDGLLGRLNGFDLSHRLIHLLALLQPVTSVSCSRYMPIVIDPQKM